MASVAQGFGYALGQASRVAFYAGQYAVARRRALAELTEREKTYQPRGQFPSAMAMRGAVLGLFRRDWQNIAAGYYPTPPGLDEPLTALDRVRRYMTDLPTITRRRLEHGHSEVLTDEVKDQYPRYYLQNFHYQTDGWLSDESARLYDHQVEVLFTGTAGPMRRQGLVPLIDGLRRSKVRRPRILDVATGTGIFMREVRRALPRARLIGLDLSPNYLDRAKKTVPGARMVQGLAEAMDFDDASFDAVTCVYLFHELPPKIRPQVMAELARVVRPGGTVVIVDALQTGDRADFDGLLEMFPVRFHEPYFNSYLATDMDAMAHEAGLIPRGQTPALLSKVFAFEKPRA